jgi:RimJ/RimL family protein N-acetyltransferase
MFGPIMEFPVGDLVVRMAPLKRSDMPEFVKNGGMQRYSVSKYLAVNFAPVEEDEYEWFDKVRADKTSRAWGVYVRPEQSGEDGAELPEWELVGTSALHDIASPYGLATAVSGFQIFKPEYWNRGIASRCHMARAMYGFDMLNLTAIRSAVMEGNEASYKALQKLGYVHVHSDRNESFRDGQWLHKHNFLLVNPAQDAWRNWWHGEESPPNFRGARTRALDALEWAHGNVTLL